MKSMYHRIYRFTFQMDKKSIGTHTYLITVKGEILNFENPDYKKLLVSEIITYLFP